MSHLARPLHYKVSPKTFQALLAFSNALRRDLLGTRLVELVVMRASQINGCAFCIDMHWADLTKQGIDARTINAVAAWREAPFFDERERAALRWTEILTATPHSDASDEEFARLKEHFSDEEIVELGFVIASINAWNILNVGLRTPLPAKV